MKRSIEWYEECLKNSRDTEERMRRNHEEQRLAIDRLIDGNNRLSAQIVEAKRRGLKAFDERRFMVKKGGAK